MSYPGEAPALRRLGLPGAVENRTANGDPVAGRGQGVTDPRRVADDSGPMKPGNSVEDNPLTTENPRTDGTGNGAIRGVLFLDDFTQQNLKLAFAR